MIDQIREWLDSLDGDFVSAVEAEKFVARAREKSPKELAAWLDEQAPRLVAEIMTGLTNSDRMRTQRRARASSFARMVEQVEAGDLDVDELPSMFTPMYVIDAENTRRRFGEMVWADVDFAASDYEERARSHAFEAAFLRAVQKRLPKNGSKTVADVFTEEQLRSLRKND